MLANFPNQPESVPQESFEVNSIEQLHSFEPLIASEFPINRNMPKWMIKQQQKCKKTKLLIQEALKRPQWQQIIYKITIQENQLLNFSLINLNNKNPLSKLQESFQGFNIQNQQIKPMFWISLQTSNFIHRLAMVNLSQSPIYLYHSITRPQQALASKKSFQVLFQINLQNYSQNKQKQLKQVLSLYGIETHNYHLHQWQLKDLTRQYSFTELISQINHDYSMVNFSNFSSLPNYENQNRQCLKDISKKYGINIQILDDQYYFAYTQHYDSNDWDAVVRLKVNRSAEKNFKAVAQLVKSLFGEFIVQCGKQINVFIEIQCKGIKRLVNALRQIVDKKIMKYYHNITVTQKTLTQDLKKFKMDDEDLFKVANYFCKSYHKNSENKKDEQEVDWSDIFPQQPQSKKMPIHQKLKIFFSDFTKDDLEKLTKEYGRNNLLFLKVYWQSGLQEYLINLYKCWNQYNGVYTEEMRKFIFLLDYKSFEIKEKYESFYPKSIPIMKAFMSKLKITSLDVQIKDKIQNEAKKKNQVELQKVQRDRIRDECLRQRQRYLQISQHLIDNIIKYLIFVQNPQRKNQKFQLSIPGQLLKDKAVNFANLISALQQFQVETSKWQDALHVVFKDLQKLKTLAKNIQDNSIQVRIQNIAQMEQYQQLKKKTDARNAYFDGIQNENLPRLNCLGCTRHFLFNMNIFDNSINRGKLIIFEKVDIINELNGLKQIIKAICSLLNDNQGGVILFNCQKKYQDACTLGAVITEDMKKQFKDKINKLLKRLYPSAQQNITVNFVPVIANPYSVKPFEGKQLFYNGLLGDIKQKKYIRRKLYEGRYAMRIIVKPTDQSQVFFYQNEDKLFFSKYQDNKIVELSISQLYKTIKQKMKFFIRQQYSFMSRNMLMMPSPFDHICQKPDEGVKIKVRYDILSPQIKNKWEESFQFVTHLEINKKEVPSFQQTLKELNIRCEIQSKFQHYQFCPANCAIMYHDIPLDDLMKIINHHNSFARLKNKIKVSKISNHLRLLNHDQDKRINCSDLELFNIRLFTEFDGSLMHLYELYFGQTSTFYVAGNSKVQNLFIFLMMNHFKQAVIFEQKPAGIIQANQGCWKESSTMAQQFNDSYSQLQLVQWEAHLVSSIILSTLLISQILFGLINKNEKYSKKKELIPLAYKKAKESYQLYRPVSEQIILQPPLHLRQYSKKEYFQRDEIQQKILDKNQKKLKHFEDILNGFEKNNFAYLYHHQVKLEQIIGQIQKQDTLCLFYRPYLEKFLDLIKIKIEIISESKLVYPAIYRIQSRLQGKLNYKGTKRKMNVDYHLTDILFQHYILQLQTRSTYKGIYCVPDPKTGKEIPLSEYIASCKEYFEPYSGWTEIFQIVTHSIIRRDANCDEKKYGPLLSADIEDTPNIVLPFHICLGCSEFFYINHNIYRTEICNHILVLVGFVSQISNNTETIKDEICALLNGNGGVLLFDCYKTYNTIVPRGRFITEKEKAGTQEKLATYLDGIYPKPQIDLNICISWVPLAKDPFEAKVIPNKKSLDFQEGVYVARIVVKPAHRHITYHWIKDGKPIFSIRTESLFPEGKKQVIDVNINRFVKKRLNNFDSFENKNCKKITSKMNHECKKPDNGAQVLHQKEETVFAVQNPGRRYKYASVVIAKKSDHEIIRKNLQRYSIECVIVAPFENLKLKGAAHSGIMYHNTRFDDLLSVISNNKDFQFGGRNLLVILITQYIRLTQRNQRNIMSQADFNSLGVWLQKQYPKQTLKMWKFITYNNDQEFYIQTGSKESSLYIYIVMTQFMERCAFKNPKSLERMDQRQRQLSFKQVYPSKK